MSDISALGVEVLKEALKTIPKTPGVYEMIGKDQSILYIGKAKNLYNRLKSYTQFSNLSHRIKRMVCEIRHVNFFCTKTEVEALILENNLITHFQPPYNVLLKDDKSYAFIRLGQDHDFPSISKYRGSLEGKAKYFGPYPRNSDIDEIIAILEKVFKLRNCSDYEFSIRKRPCLQYDIQRCTAPCVGKVTKEGYKKQVTQAKDFLTGKIQDLLKYYQSQMYYHSDRLEFEQASQYKDKISTIQRLKQKQHVQIAEVENADIIAIYQDQYQTYIEQSIVRFHKQLGSQTFFLEPDIEKNIALHQFIIQFYKNNIPAKELLLSDEPEELQLLKDYLYQKHGFPVKITIPQKGVKRQLIEFTKTQAKNAFMRGAKAEVTLDELLGKSFKRIEVYDNSHFQGNDPYGAMIVVGPKGFERGAYRKFYMTSHTNDDYAMMRMMLERRLKHDEWPLPDIVLIDGGVGQINAVRHLFQGKENILLLGMAKGVDRKSDTLYQSDGVILEMSYDLKHFLQNIRDEAHRFAISTHRYKRQGKIWKSKLDEIPSIGIVRKKLLLKHFGSIERLSKAKLNELECIKGVTKKIAQRVWQYFQEK